MLNRRCGVRKIISMGLVVFFILCVLPVFADDPEVDAGTVIAEKFKKEREAYQKKKQEQDAKKDSSNSKVEEKDSIPGKLVFHGVVERVEFPIIEKAKKDIRRQGNGKNSDDGTVVIKLSDGQTVSAAYSTNFIKDGHPAGLTNIMMGIKVAIVNPLPEPKVPAGEDDSKEKAAAEKKTATCTISEDSKLYFGGDADKLSQYYPPAQEESKDKKKKEKN